MTAYGRAAIETPFGQWVIEIHSINRKMLDISIHLPRELLRFDTEIRKWITEAISRGQITVRVNSSFEGAAQASYSVLSALKQFWEKIAKDLGYNPKEAVDLAFLTQQMHFLPQEVSKDQESQLLSALKQGVQETLKALIQMKEKEGGALEKDVEMRLKLIESTLAKISRRSPEVVERSREKMREKMKEIIPVLSEMEARLAQEVALLAEKLDITEELTRLDSHLQQFFERLKSGEKALGRTLDFLVQEMHREINTIASKSADAGISQEAITVKSELEKIREQIQNIE